jgi:hypothetical protein
MKRSTPDDAADTVLIESTVRALIDDRNACWREGTRLALEIQLRILLARNPDFADDDTEAER